MTHSLLYISISFYPMTRVSSCDLLSFHTLPVSSFPRTCILGILASCTASGGALKPWSLYLRHSQRPRTVSWSSWQSSPFSFLHYLQSPSFSISYLAQSGKEFPLLKPLPPI